MGLLEEGDLVAKELDLGKSVDVDITPFIFLGLGGEVLPFYLDLGMLVELLISFF